MLQKMMSLFLVRAIRAFSSSLWASEAPKKMKMFFLTRAIQGLFSSSFLWGLLKTIEVTARMAKENSLKYVAKCDPLKPQ